MTIEHHLFRAFANYDLIKSASDCDYSRCGRTDKCVSSSGNVIALSVRSNLHKKAKKEFPYALMLNGVLPKDIRILATAKVNQKFSARYHCKYREYKYFFPRGELDVNVMCEACKLFLGEHDFRNFCKMDIITTTSFVRRIQKIGIQRIDYAFPLFKGGKLQI